MSKEISITKIRIIGLIILLFFFLVLNQAITQYVASNLNYSQALGDPFFLGLYKPFSSWWWTFSYYEFAPHIFNYAFIFLCLGILVGLVSFVLVVGFVGRKSQKYTDVHGTARFATIEDVDKMGLISRIKKKFFGLKVDKTKASGVYCGAFLDEKTGDTYYLRHDGPEHICALAPTRSGKGVGLVLPTLLSWPHSLFVLDIKGENYAITSGWRKKEANNVILKFDPAEPGTGCSWNPLAEIRHKTRYQVSDTQNIALMLIDDDGKGISGDHFRTAAYELLVGVILHALYKGEKVGRLPSPQDIAHMLTSVGDFASKDNTESESQDDGDPRALQSLFDEMKNVDLGSDSSEREAMMVIGGVGRRMGETPARELGSIISTANNALALYRDPIVGDNTSRSDFVVADLMDHDKPVSLYFITTPKNRDRMRPLARLLITLIVSTLADQMQFDDGRSKTNHKQRLLLMLDEFPSLGKLDVLESSLAFIAGYGIKAYLITQDISQLYKSYTNNESIIANCHLRLAYAPNNVQTAEWMSKMTGQSTVVKEQISTSGKKFGMVLDNVSRNYQEVQRPLMTPDEIMRLPGPEKDGDGYITKAGEMLIFVAGNPVIKGRQILYFNDPVFSNRSKIKPPKNSDSVRSFSFESSANVVEGFKL